MKQRVLVAAVVAAIALPALAAQPATAENAGADANGPTVSFADGPTGFTFVWHPERGWQFVGRQSGADSKKGLVDMASIASREGFEEGAAVAVFVDASTGFRFVWRYGAGWQFAGRQTSQREALRRVAAVAGELH